MRVISKFAASAIADAATSLRAGNLVAFPTETVYGLGADAQNKSAVTRVYQAKGRPLNHPLIVHLSSIDLLDKWTRDIPEYALTLAKTFWPGPMTLILQRTAIAKDFITGGQNNVGIRVPAHDLALALLKEFESQGGLGVAAPSANRFGAVSPTTAEAVRTELDEYLSESDLILDGGLSLVGVESTIIDCTKKNPVILRPGGITLEMLQNLLPNKILSIDFTENHIRAPGLLQSHYAPNAKIFLSGTSQVGDGFIALSKFPTPKGSIRLASPKNITEYAQILYSALRLADSWGIKNVYVLAPSKEGIGYAINDRLEKASFKSNVSQLYNT